MITEDYVSFEIAKLLKEKGFDSEEVGCRDGFYSETAYESGHGIMTERGKEVGLVYDDLLNSELSHDEYLRPTLQIAMKWLREVYKIIISFNASFVNSIEPHFSWEIRINSLTSLNDKKHFEPIYIHVKNESFEKACEAAIKYCLKNLI